eukprot:6151091-Pyramimonas_sp.AAC.1
MARQSVEYRDLELSLRQNLDSNIFQIFVRPIFTQTSEHCYVTRELYEGPGGNLVDGLPPAPSSGAGLS